MQALALPFFLVHVGSLLDISSCVADCQYPHCPVLGVFGFIKTKSQECRCIKVFLAKGMLFLHDFAPSATSAPSSRAAGIADLIENRLLVLINMSIDIRLFLSCTVSLYSNDISCF
jgi:hypothetical protein